MHCCSLQQCLLLYLLTLYQIISKTGVRNEIYTNQFMIESNTHQVREQSSQKPKIVIVSPKTFHKNTLIWIHGLHQYPEKYLFIFNDPIFDNFKIIAPEAPTRFVTVLNKQTRSWFDIKFRSQKSFIVPFDQAFSSGQVTDSFQNYLKPLIDKARQELDKLTEKGKLIIAGFSQGCGMSFHSFYKQNDKIDGVIGISGYLFPITPFILSGKFERVLYGEIDDLRPWEFVKVTYEGKIEKDKITIVKNTRHEINEEMAKELQNRIRQFLGE